MEIEELIAPVESRSEAGNAGLSRRGRTFLLTIAVAFATLLGVRIFDGIRARIQAETVLAHETRQSAITTVKVVTPKPGAPADELLLPGNAEAFTDTPVYARTNGYVKKWYADIGTKVKAGQLLAEIETPEIDQQLQEARAQFETAQANYSLAQSTATRYQALLGREAVSRQETDDKVGDRQAKKAVMDAAAANMKRLENLQGFQKVYAPFDGMITARNIDIGSLINAGSNDASKQLFHIAAIQKVRVYVRVPQVNSRSAAPGTQADLTLPELPGHHFRAQVVRNSSAIDAASRTLLVEVDVDNPSGILLPGAFVEVHLKLPAPTHSLTVPVNALIFRSEGLRVAAVRNKRIDLLPITVGHDYGDAVEVTSGIQPDERLVVNPPDSIFAGQEVQVAESAEK
jgi:RND family efflux transporter MFP subunit